MATMDLASLKEYVTSSSSSQRMADSTVILHITHSNLKRQFLGIRFDRHMLIEKVKEKLHAHTGTSVHSMLVELYDAKDSLVAVLSDDSRPLGFYSPANLYRLHVVDLDPTSLSARGALEDTSLVDKYVMSEEDYNKREGSMRKFKEQRLANDPTWTLRKEMLARRGDPDVTPATEVLRADYMASLAAEIKVGDRFEVEVGGKRGTVAFIGQVEGLPAGWWIGVNYDEPLGKHDGSIKGKRFFQCPPNHGSFLRPDLVKVGDYPERDLFDDDDPDEI